MLTPVRRSVQSLQYGAPNYIMQRTRFELATWRLLRELFGLERGVLSCSEKTPLSTPGHWHGAPPLCDALLCSQFYEGWMYP